MGVRMTRRGERKRVAKRKPELPPPRPHVYEQTVRRGRSDDGVAFMPDFTDGGPARSTDDLAEELAEGFITAATSGEEVGEDVRDEWFDEEIGGPFVETTGREEFAAEPDESNPLDANKEPFPTATRGN